MATTDPTIPRIRQHSATKIAARALEGAGAIALAGSFLVVYALFIVAVYEVFANAGAPISQMQAGVPQAFDTVLNVPPAALLGAAVAYTANTVNELFDKADRFSVTRCAAVAAGVWFLPNGFFAAWLLLGLP